jgi:hypothetical protein
LPLHRRCHRGRRRGLMHHWSRRRSLLMDRRLRWRRICIMFRLPLRSRRERLRRRIVLPFRLYRRRTLIIRAPYRFGRWLMVVTPATEIASPTARVASGLPINDLRIALAIDSSVIIVHVGFGLWWRIVSPRHSRYIVIGIDAPVTSVVSTGTAKRMLIAIAVSSTNGTSTSSYRSARHGRFMVISARAAINHSPICRRKRRMEAWRRIHQPRPAIPSAPAARRPAPATSVHKHPPAIAIRHPAPGI